MSDQPKIQFFEFKARKFCVWFDKTADSGDYDGLVATQIVSGLVASAAKLLRIRIAGTPQDVVIPDGPLARPAPSLENFPIECRSDWAEICRHRARTGGLPGCLFEVQHELERGLALLDSGRTCEALSYWQLGYVHNWGELAICALMTMHGAMADASSS